MLPVVLLVAFLLVPIVEIYVILQVGHLIGGWPTVALLVVESLLGAWIVRREGRRAWRALTTTLQDGRMPERELANAALVLVGGVLLLTPGFVTDLFGFLFVLPFTRPLVRRLLMSYFVRRVQTAQDRAMRSVGGFGDGFDGRFGGGPGARTHDTEPVVVRGEVIEEDRENGSR
jgi:UPF0716 family protein affecting phage T7 exclusion